MHKKSALEKKDKNMEKEAFALVARLFKGKKRSDGKSLQTDHSQNVYEILKKYSFDKEILIAGILHDCIEDSEKDYDFLDEKFGKKVADIVSIVSQDKRLSKKEREKEYEKRIKMAGASAQYVKIADMIENLQSAKKNCLEEMQEWLRNWYREFNFRKEVKKHAIYKN